MPDTLPELGSGIRRMAGSGSVGLPLAMQRITGAECYLTTAVGNENVAQAPHRLDKDGFGGVGFDELA